ncbi:MAG TPA: DUF92 domain-containing protein [Thermoplasmatales archaeon]|nr:MAG: hypothetical protein DRN07_05445 [Thermoplasmata archaeon]HDN50906.1 DUF92 domain-containing protein [Thermoplasmatales archaeon]
MIDIAINIVICGAFAGLSLQFNVLDIGGTIFAFIVGSAILFTQGLSWFSLLVLFLVLGALATKYKRNFKRRRLHERPSRKAMNVIANGAVPALLALFSLRYDFAVPFVTSIAVAMADTIASELGVLSNNAYLITTFKKVEAGTNGAISPLGEFVALAGASLIAVAGYFLLHLSGVEAVLCMSLGLLGCHIDSLLGATFQGKYKGMITGQDTVLTNSDVNLISISLTALLAVIIVEAL